MKGKKGHLLWIVLFLLALTAHAQPNVLLTLKDINTGQDIDSVIVNVDLGESVLTKYVEEGEILRLELDEGGYEADLRANDLSTPGKDYHGTASLEVENTLIKAILLYPVGTLRGIVKDKLDNVVSNAKLKFECSGNCPDGFPEATDDFGSFSVEYMPIGECTIYASYRDMTGRLSIDMGRGNLSNYEIMMDKSLLREKSNLASWMISIAILLIIAYFAIKYNMIGKASPKKEKKEKEEKRAEDKAMKKIMETLNEREKKVVSYLLEHNNASMQSSVRHATSLPRTTLSRIVNSLEKKKIIEVEKHGKSVKLTLTDFFLGKG
jgi:uncharacterized membrane protein